MRSGESPIRAWCRGQGPRGLSDQIGDRGCTEKTTGSDHVATVQVDLVRSSRPLKVVNKTQHNSRQAGTHMHLHDG